MNDKDLRALQRLNEIAERDPAFLDRLEAWLDSLPDECEECGQGGIEPGKEHKSSCSHYRDFSDTD